jgi:hypothetical protein
MTSTVKLCSLRPAERERHAMTSNSECPGRRHDTATLSAWSASRPVLMLRSVLIALTGGAAGPANGPCVADDFALIHYLMRSAICRGSKRSATGPVLVHHASHGFGFHNKWGLVWIQSPQREAVCCLSGRRLAACAAKQSPDGGTSQPPAGSST